MENHTLLLKHISTKYCTVFADCRSNPIYWLCKFRWQNYQLL